MRSFFDFEKPAAELQAKIAELRALEAKGEPVALGDEISRLETKLTATLSSIYANLTPWQKTEVARADQRPHFVHYIQDLISEFTPLAGDRKFAEDEAIIGGFGRFQGQSVCVLGHEKGANIEQRLKHNFGKSCAVMRILAAASCARAESRHRIDAAASGEATV